MFLSDRFFHIKETLFIILFIIYLVASPVFMKAPQFEQKENKQLKKMVLFNPFISNIDVT